MKATTIMKNVMKRLVRVGCMAVAVFCIAACDSDLDIQTAYPFHVETMPVPLRVAQGETVEIRCSLLAEGRTDDTQYTIRWFLYDGKGTLKYNGRKLLANDRYPLLGEEFRLYYTSASSDSHSFIVVIEDNHGQIEQLDFKFNNDNDEEETATIEKGGQSIGTIQ